MYQTHQIIKFPGSCAKIVTIVPGTHNDKHANTGDYVTFQVRIHIVFVPTSKTITKQSQVFLAKAQSCIYQYTYVCGWTFILKKLRLQCK